jgi:hypothetical protein
MKSRRQLGWILTVLISLCLTTGLAAQSQPGDNNPGANPGGNNPAGDPPARVVRVQFISGEVSMQPGGANDWVAASLNRPLTTSDRVWTDKDSRAELNVGNAFIRMNSESSVTLANVSDNTTQLQLDQGTLELSVQHLEPGEIFEINTPNLAFTVMKSGFYRIDVPPNTNETWVTVRKGQGEATGNAPAVKVNSGSQIRFSGQGTLQNASFAAPAPDGFDDWASVRDKRLDGSQSAKYVAPGVIGYQDLDYYGSWQVVPTYGAIWVPTSVPVGWAPYRNGRWVWVSPWGWTWVDAAPWGFAPFHYGRWVFYGGAWGWAPGPVYVGWRPYYAPALVGWVGGAGWGVSVSFGFGIGGGCGWFPLGWGEPYYPWYHGYRGGYVSNNYIRNVNVTNTHITNITNVTNNYYSNGVNNIRYANRNVAGAVTAAPKSALANGENIGKVGRTLNASELAHSQLMRSADVTPAREAMLGGKPAAGSAIPPRTVQNHGQLPATSPVRAADARVPTPPASMGVHNPNEVSSPPHTVPQPSTHTATSAPAVASSPVQAGNQHVVPKPPYAGGHAPTASDSVQRSSNSSYPTNHTEAPAREVNHTAPVPPQPSHSSGKTPPEKSKPAESKSNPGMASSNVARPPSGYSYHAAPAYTASGYTGSSHSNSASRSYSPAPSPYVSQRSSAPAQSSYRAGSYTPPAASYSAHMSAPATPHYSAPSYSGGGGHSYSGGESRSSASGGHNSGHSR